MMHYGSVPFDMNTARWGYPTTENGFCLTPNVCRGRSRGTVRLRSRDYRDRARVDPRYFTDPEGHDERVMLYGIRLARKIVAQPAMADWAGARAGSRARRAVRRRAHRLHPQDPQHRLPPGLHRADGPRRRPRCGRSTRGCGSRGVDGLRVGRRLGPCPFLPAINPYITTMMIGEKCAETCSRNARASAAPASPRRRAS